MKHGVQLGNTYINDKACKIFVTSIAGQLKLSSKLQSSKFISVMADSACDVGVREVEDVYTCHLVKGEIANSFVAEGLRKQQSTWNQSSCGVCHNRGV